MPGVGLINTTGVPSPKEYQIGGGKLYLATLLASGLPGAFRHVGNVPSITLTVATETYEHNSSTTPTPVQDYSAITKISSSGKFTLENKNAENLALFLLGTTAAYTNPAIAGFSSTPLVGAGNLVKNSYYQVMTAAGLPAFDLDSSKITLTTTNATPVTLVLNTDYTVDAMTGMIFIKDTAAITTAISGNEGINCVLAADAGASLVDQVKVLTDTSKKVAARLVQYNSGDDDKVSIIDFHKIALSADGDLNLITSEVDGLPMAFQVEENTAYSQRIDVYTPTTQA
jgi:hypothetical protein